MTELDWATLKEIARNAREVVDGRSDLEPDEMRVMRAALDAIAGIWRAMPESVRLALAASPVTERPADARFIDAETAARFAAADDPVGGYLLAQPEVLVGQRVVTAYQHRDRFPSSTTARSSRSHRISATPTMM